MYSIKNIYVYIYNNMYMSISKYISSSLFPYSLIRRMMNSKAGRTASR